MNASHASVNNDERVVLDGDTRADTIAFQAFVAGETRRATVDGPNVAVSPLPEHAELQSADEDPSESQSHHVEFESLPSGRYWCDAIHDNGEYKRAIFTPVDDDLRGRLAAALDAADDVGGDA